MGLLCHGPLLGGRTETFVAADDWLADTARPQLPREQALANLARYHVHAFGPAAPRDFAAWAGLPLRDARSGWHAIRDELVEITAAGEAAWIARQATPRLEQVYDDARPPIVRLLGAFDTYLLGYRGRDLAVAPRHASRVNAGGGMIRPIVTIDGEAVARWTLTRRSAGRVIEISVEPFEDSDGNGAAPAALNGDAMRQALERETADIGRFLGAEGRLVSP